MGALDSSGLTPYDVADLFDYKKMNQINNNSRAVHAGAVNTAQLLESYGGVPVSVPAGAGGADSVQAQQVQEQQLDAGERELRVPLSAQVSFYLLFLLFLLFFLLFLLFLLFFLLFLLFLLSFLLFLFFLLFFFFFLLFLLFFLLVLLFFLLSPLLVCPHVNKYKKKLQEPKNVM
ncbi:hypothetical protein T492DRAFT_261919 [Pavlovales sp. CCMP2436]|nr:hypothetical protein T492DRAFT_261919 [Pavlovales sp. CCMP2436]